ncbi:MAG: DUF177 domain-containing protein [Lachnospiraceae bacterium]|nr:DUF177 domain-containing protein [Lachnospiraceae bacterium]MDE6981126.1 DUF177 domain-containing protein [Lachnospiraceae bacterium]
MKVDVTDLLSTEDKAFEQEVEIELPSFQSKLGEFPIITKAPFVLHLENQKKRFLKVTGTADVVVAIPCDRCLKEVPVTLHLVIDRKFYLKEPEMEEETDAEDMDCIKESALDVDRLIYDEILVNWPMKVLCRDDCKGICRKCGTNLNDNTCSCDQSEPDPRMAAAWDIFNQFKEV